MNPASELRRLQFRLFLFAFAISRLGCAQDQGEMLLVKGTLVAITPPPMFERQSDPEEVFFAPKGFALEDAPAFIHLGIIQICGACEFTTLPAFVQEDVQNFQKRFPKGKAKFHSNFKLEKKGLSIPIWGFESGEKANAYERLAMLETGASGRVLLFTLSGRTRKDLDKYWPMLLTMLSSYKGIIALQ